MNFESCEVATESRTADQSPVASPTPEPTPVRRLTCSRSVLDRQLQEAAQEVLNIAGYHVLTMVNVHVTNGHVLLTGRVPSYYLKAVATAAILKLKSAKELKNELRVVRGKERHA